METRGFWVLDGVSDGELERGLTQLVVSGCRTEARIVAHIAEVGRRRLFLREGFSTLYKYCQERLGLSESEAWHRTTAARIARKYPVVFDLIERREIHLSGLCKLHRFLTRANHQDLLKAACGKTKKQVEELLAVRFPGTKVHDSMRRLPSQRITPVIAVPERGALSQSNPIVASERTAGAGVAIGADAGVPRAGVSVVQSPERLGAFAPHTGEVTLARPESEREPETPRAAAQPEPRYRVQFEASGALKAKIELARALSSHANPSGDLETLFERALDVYVEQLQKKRFGKTDKPRRKEAKSVARGQRVVVRRRAHIPNDTRREVVAKDGLCCAYVSASGKRCNEQAFLQLHHEQPWAREPCDHPDNLRVFCASHNRLLAEQEFGVEYVAQRIAESEGRKAPA